MLTRVVWIVEQVSEFDDPMGFTAVHIAGVRRTRIQWYLVPNWNKYSCYQSINASSCFMQQSTMLLQRTSSSFLKPVMSTI